MKETTTTCFVCGKPSDTRCSQCKEAIFCSRRCQKLVSSPPQPPVEVHLFSLLTGPASWQVYPTHKYICSIPDKSTFYLPPITRAEAEFMKKYLRDIEVTGRLGFLHSAWAGRMFQNYIYFTTLYNGSFDVSFPRSFPSNLALSHFRDFLLTQTFRLLDPGRYTIRNVGNYRCHYCRLSYSSSRPSAHSTRNPCSVSPLRHQEDRPTLHAKKRYREATWFVQPRSFRLGQRHAPRRSTRRPFRRESSSSTTAATKAE